MAEFDEKILIPLYKCQLCEQLFKGRNEGQCEEEPRTCYPAEAYHECNLPMKHMQADAFGRGFFVGILKDPTEEEGTQLQMAVAWTNTYGTVPKVIVPEGVRRKVKE